MVTTHGSAYDSPGSSPEWVPRFCSKAGQGLLEPSSLRGGTSVQELQLNIGIVTVITEA